MTRKAGTRTSAVHNDRRLSQAHLFEDKTSIIILLDCIAVIILIFIKWMTLKRHIGSGELGKQLCRFVSFLSNVFVDVLR